MSKLTLKTQANLTRENDVIDSINNLKRGLRWESIDCLVASQRVWWKSTARLSPKVRASAVAIHPSRTTQWHNSAKLNTAPCPVGMHSPETAVNFFQELAKKLGLEGPWQKGKKEVCSVSWLSPGLPPSAHTAQEKTRTGAGRKSWILKWCLF